MLNNKKIKKIIFAALICVSTNISFGYDIVVNYTDLKENNFSNNEKEVFFSIKLPSEITDNKISEKPDVIMERGEIIEYENASGFENLVKWHKKLLKSNIVTPNQTYALIGEISIIEKKESNFLVDKFYLSTRKLDNEYYKTNISNGIKSQKPPAFPDSVLIKKTGSESQLFFYPNKMAQKKTDQNILYFFNLFYASKDENNPSSKKIGAANIKVEDRDNNDKEESPSYFKELIKCLDSRDNFSPPYYLYYGDEKKIDQKIKNKEIKCDYNKKLKTDSQECDCIAFTSLKNLKDFLINNNALEFALLKIRIDGKEKSLDKSSLFKESVRICTHNPFALPTPTPTPLISEDQQWVEYSVWVENPQYPKYKSRSRNQWSNEERFFSTYQEEREVPRGEYVTYVRPHENLSFAYEMQAMAMAKEKREQSTYNYDFEGYKRAGDALSEVIDEVTNEEEIASTKKIYEIRKHIFEINKMKVNDEDDFYLYLRALVGFSNLIKDLTKEEQEIINRYLSPTILKEIKIDKSSNIIKTFKEFTNKHQESLSTNSLNVFIDSLRAY